ARLDSLSEFDPALQEVAALVQSVQAELSEAVSTLRRYTDRVDLDPARLGEIDRRMEAVLSAARKFRVQPDGLPGLLEGWQQRLAVLDASTDLAALEARVAVAREDYLAKAKVLSAGRRQTAEAM